VSAYALWYNFRACSYPESAAIRDLEFDKPVRDEFRFEDMRDGFADVAFIWD
jgi:hypothetical protein